MERPVIYIILYLIFLPVWIFSRPTPNNFHHLSVKEGLPSAQVFHMLQDREGYMWFATKSGLSKYDGYAFTNYTVNDGISKNDVRKIFEDSQGRIWVLSQGALSIRQHGSFAVYDTLLYIGNNRITSILEGKDGTIWLTSPLNVSYITPDFQIGQIHPSLLNKRGIPKLEFVDQAGDIWMFEREYFTVIRGQEVLRKVPLGFPVQGGDLNFATCLLSDGVLLYSSLDGVVAIGNDSTEYLAFPASNKTGDLTSCMVEDHNGKVWVGTTQNGVSLLRREGEYFVEENQFLAGMHITHIQEDVEGNVWFSTQNQGVWLLSANAVEVIRTNELLRGGAEVDEQFYTQRFQAMSEGVGEELWLGSEQGELIRLSGDINNLQKQTIALTEQLGRDVQITQLLPLRNDEILVGTNNGMIWYAQGKVNKLYYLPRPTSLRRAKNGDILFGNTEENDFRIPVDQLPAFSDPEQGELTLMRLLEDENTIFSFETEIYFEDSYQNQWISWPQGIYRMIGGEKVDFDSTYLVFKAGVNDIEETPDSLIWVATNGSGLIVVKGDGDDYDIVNAANGLISEVCYDMLIDEVNKAVWVATNRGIGKIAGYSFKDKKFPIRWFDMKDGFNSDDVLKLARYKELIFVLTHNGIAAFNPASIENESFQPPIYITNFSLDGNQEPMRAHYDLEHDQNNIRIEFTGISFRNLGRLRYRYSLEGENWDETMDPYVNYSSLKAGNYTFTVKAVSRDGVESIAPRTLTISIAPVFYRTWWFAVIVLVAIGAIFLGLLKYLYSERQRMVLEERVAQKTYTLNQKVEELHRTNQDLEQFAYVASHDLKTPLRTIIGHLQLLERRYKGKMDEQADEFIVFAVNAAKRMYNMINDLLLYAKVGRGEMVFETVDLNHVVHNVEESLGGMLLEKNGKIFREKLPVIQGIPSQWEMLFQNLIGNGLKFNLSEQPEVAIQFKDSPHFWILSVTDNGIGVDEEYQSRVFELFQRLHTTEFPGTGLGLAICKRIVEGHGGSIWFESEKGKGTTFFFTIEKSQS